MPTISQFYGILIMMRLREKEHNPPHIHARYGGHVASFLIENGEINYGSFPNSGAKFVKEFIKRYKKELMEMWDTGKYKQLPPIE